MNTHCNEYFSEKVKEISKNKKIIPDLLDSLDYIILCEYSSYSYNLNNYLRSKQEKNDKYECFFNILNQAINKLPKYEHINKSLFRGTQLPVNELFKIEEKCEYVEEGFFSTSEQLERAEHHMVLDIGSHREPEWVIGIFELLESKQGINLSNYVGTQYLDGTEILFPSGMKFEVIEFNWKIKKFEDGERKMFWIKLKPNYFNLR